MLHGTINSLIAQEKENAFRIVKDSRKKFFFLVYVHTERDKLV